MTPDQLQSALDRTRFNSDGLVPAIIQEHGSGVVLMLGWMDAEAMRRTLSDRVVTFWSRSRQEYWRKGDTSGNRFNVVDAALDCDADTMLITVAAVVAACHTGAHSCFDVDPLPLAQESGQS